MYPKKSEHRRAWEKMGLCKKWQTANGAKPRFLSGKVGVCWFEKDDVYKLKDGTYKKRGAKGGRSRQLGWYARFRSKKHFGNNKPHRKTFYLNQESGFDVMGVAKQCVAALEWNEKEKKKLGIPVADSKYKMQ